MKTESNINKREIEIEKLKKYKYGFSTDIENTRAPKGLTHVTNKMLFLNL